MRKRIHEIPIEPDEGQKQADEARGLRPETGLDAGHAPLPSSETSQDSAALETPSPAKASYPEVVEHLQRLQAEFNNYRRRVERDRLETSVWAQRALIEKLVPVLDDLERAMGLVGGESGAAAQGLALIRDKLMNVLTEAGLERIATQDEVFDPERHEALATLPVEPERSGKIIEELVPGFTFRGKLVRPARVTVGVEESGEARDRG